MEHRLKGAARRDRRFLRNVGSSESVSFSFISAGQVRAKQAIN